MPVPLFPCAIMLLCLDGLFNCPSGLLQWLIGDACVPRRDTTEDRGRCLDYHPFPPCFTMASFRVRLAVCCFLCDRGQGALFGFGWAVPGCSWVCASALLALWPGARCFWSSVLLERTQRAKNEGWFCNPLAVFWQTNIIEVLAETFGPV